VGNKPGKKNKMTVNAQVPNAEDGSSLEYFGLGKSTESDPTISTSDPVKTETPATETEPDVKPAVEPEVKTAEDLGLEPYDDKLYGNRKEKEKPTNKDESRFEYWQSQADKWKREAEEAKKTQVPEELLSIAQYIQTNPQVLDVVEKSLSNPPLVTPQVADPQTEPVVTEELKKPERPVKPSNYDPIEAYSDEESASFKYREAKEAYSDQMLDYYDRLETQRLQALEQQQKQVENIHAVETLKSELISKHGYTPERAEEFVNYFSNPQSLSVENLIALDALRHAPSQAEIEARAKAEAMRAKASQLETPAPAAVVPGESEPQVSEEDMFNLGLLKNRRK